MSINSLEDNTYWMLLQVAIRSKHDFAHLGDQYDLSLMQLITLCALKPSEPIPMNTISCLLVCDASNVTGIVERLVSRGYIVREESREDRRVKVIQMTREGEAVREIVLREITGSQPESLSGLTPVEYEELNHLLRKALLPKA